MCIGDKYFRCIVWCVNEKMLEIIVCEVIIVVSVVMISSGISV